MDNCVIIALIAVRFEIVNLAIKFTAGVVLRNQIVRLKIFDWLCRNAATDVHCEVQSSLLYCHCVEAGFESQLLRPYSLQITTARYEKTSTISA